MTFIENYNNKRIPYKHFTVDIINKLYKLYPQSNMGLLVVYENNVLNDIYFETKCEVFDNNHENDILTFLSLLKNIK